MGGGTLCMQWAEAGCLPSRGTEMPMKLSYVPDICPVPGAHEYVVLVSLQFVALVEAGCSPVNGRVILMILACMLCGNADLPGVVLKDIFWSFPAQGSIHLSLTWHCIVDAKGKHIHW